MGEHGRAPAARVRAGGSGGSGVRRRLGAVPAGGCSAAVPDSLLMKADSRLRRVTGEENTLCATT